MTPSDHPQSAQRRRDNFFRGTLRDPATRTAEQENDVRGNDDPLIQRAEQQLHEAITSIALSIGIPSLQSGEIASMIQKATPSLRGMSRQQLASLSPSSSLLQSLAATTFNPAMTPEAAQRLRLEQIKASYHGTGIVLTDAQLAGLEGRGGVFGGAGRSGEGRGGFAGLDRMLNERRAGDYGSMAGGASVYSYSPVNYSGSVFQRAGMEYSTFSKLRSEGFAGTQIVHAAQDSRTNGFSANDPKITKAFAVLDRDDGERREERNTQLKTFRDKLGEDAEITRLKALRDQATGEDRRKLDEQLITRGLEVSKSTGTRQFLDAAPTAAAREQGRVVEMETIKKITGANFDLRANVGVATTLALANALPAELNDKSTLPNGTQAIMADAARRDRERPADEVFGDLASLARPTTPTTPSPTVVPPAPKQADTPAAVPQSQATEVTPPKDGKTTQVAEAKLPAQPKTAAPTMKV